MELTAEQQKAIEQQKEHCPFCQIVKGKIPAQKVYEDERIIAVLDINPASPGHLLVMPKEHYPILPLIPPEEFSFLFRRVREIAKYVREAMVNTKSHIFIANGQAAGQQSTHFLVHIIPSDNIPQNFVLPTERHDAAKVQEVGSMLAHNLPLMLKKNAPQFQVSQTPVTDLAMLIEENQELRDLIKNNPGAVLAGLDDNPSLKPLFEGVDVHALSLQLNAMDADIPQPGLNSPAPVAKTPSPAPSTEVPIAVQMSDEELRTYIDNKESLRNYLMNNMATLKEALLLQPKLQAFFANTTPEEVLARYNGKQRRFGGSE